MLSGRWSVRTGTCDAVWISVDPIHASQMLGEIIPFFPSESRQLFGHLGDRPREK